VRTVPRRRFFPTGTERTELAHCWGHNLVAPLFQQGRSKPAPLRVIPMVSDCLSGEERQPSPRLWLAGKELKEKFPAIHVPFCGGTEFGFRPMQRAARCFARIRSLGVRSVSVVKSSAIQADSMMRLAYWVVSPVRIKPMAAGTRFLKSTCGSKTSGMSANRAAKARWRVLSLCCLNSAAA